MNIHEYQAKAILRDFGAPVAVGFVAMTAADAEKGARDLASPVVVVKAQIHAGGRGKGRFKEAEAGQKGGVRLARSPAEAAEHARAMLGRTLVTKQTGPSGRQVTRVYVEQGTDIARELYLSVLLDRATGSIAFIASQAGGVDIEEVAAKTPEKIVTVHVDPAAGYMPFVGRDIAYGLGLTGQSVEACVALAGSLYRAFTAKDMNLLEINPLVVTKAGELLCLDAKVNFDDNALFRHPDIAALHDPAEDDPREVEAQKAELSYVALDGTIGCMVNGAGLAMATMDIIKLYGAEPANFLDVGGGASKEKVAAGFKIITADPRVKGILVNIFGGIMRCDVVAEGIIAAVREVGLTVPLVVRLEGTKVAEGKAIIAKSGLNVIPADDLDDAAQKVVAAVRGKAA
jgi:succinyl-CoA synthetase beta subunit